MERCPSANRWRRCRGPTVKSLFGGEAAPTNFEDRAARVHNALYDHIREREVQFRLYLRNALLRWVDPNHTDEPQRPAFRLELLDAALEPLEDELNADEVQRLKAALSILIGPEAMIALRDVLRLDHKQARASGEWAVRQMVRSGAATRPTPLTATDRHSACVCTPSRAHRPSSPTRPEARADRVTAWGSLRRNRLLSGAGRPNETALRSAGKGARRYRRVVPVSAA